MEEQNLHDELASIRNLMERSSKFISLSGLSGILAGIYALIGAAFAFSFIYNARAFGNGNNVIYLTDYNWQLVCQLLTVAIVVLIASLATGLILAQRKAKRKNQPIWGEASKQLLFNMAVPLVAGGLLAVVMLLKGHIGFISSITLIFYGVALVSASNFTYKDVRYLGLLEILLGLFAAYVPGFGLYFWALGFGVLHIIYGSVVYFKYDR